MWLPQTDVPFTQLDNTHSRGHFCQDNSRPWQEMPTNCHIDLLPGGILHFPKENAGFQEEWKFVVIPTLRRGKSLGVSFNRRRWYFPPPTRAARATWGRVCSRNGPRGSVITLVYQRPCTILAFRYRAGCAGITNPRKINVSLVSSFINTQRQGYV